MCCFDSDFFHLRQGDTNPFPFPKIPKLKDTANLQNFVKNWSENKLWSVSEKLAGLPISLCTDGHVCGKSKVFYQFKMKECSPPEIRGPQVKKNKEIAKHMIRDDGKDMQETVDVLEQLHLMSESMKHNFKLPHMEMLLYGVLIPKNQQLKTFKYMTKEKQYFSNAIYCHSLGFLPPSYRLDSDFELLRKMPWLKSANYNGKHYYVWHMDEKLADWFDKFLIERIMNYKIKNFQDIVQEGDENLEKQYAAGYVLYSKETKEMYQLEQVSAKNENELKKHLKLIEEAKKTKDFEPYTMFKIDDSDESDDEKETTESPKKMRKFIDMSLFY